MSNDQKVSDDGYYTYICKSCGAQLVGIYDTSAVGFCSYCGGQSIIRSKMKKANFDKIIPFSLSKMDAKQFYLESIKKVPFVSDELKNESSFDEMRGIYIPYYNIKVNLNGHLCMKEDESIGKSSCHNCYDTDVDYEGDTILTIDVSVQFDDVIGGIMSLCDDKLEDFNETYLNDFYVEVPDADPGIYCDLFKDVLKDVPYIVYKTKAYKDRVEYRNKAMPEGEECKKIKDDFKKKEKKAIYDDNIYKNDMYKKDESINYDDIGKFNAFSMYETSHKNDGGAASKKDNENTSTFLKSRKQSQLNMNVLSHEVVLNPIYFYTHKFKDRVCYGIIKGNRMNTSFYAEIPIDFKKYVLSSSIISVVIWLLFMILRVGSMPHSFVLFLMMLTSIIGLFLYNMSYQRIEAKKAGLNKYKYTYDKVKVQISIGGPFIFGIFYLFSKDSRSILFNYLSTGLRIFNFLACPVIFIGCFVWFIIIYEKTRKIGEKVSFNFILLFMSSSMSSIVCFMSSLMFFDDEVYYVIFTILFATLFIGILGLCNMYNIECSRSQPHFEREGGYNDAD